MPQAVGVEAHAPVGAERRRGRRTSRTRPRARAARRRRGGRAGRAPGSPRYSASSKRRPACSATVRPSSPARASAASSRTIERGVPAPSNCDLVDDRDLHRERQRVEHRERERLPLRRQRAADRDEARHARLEHALVDAERHGRLAARLLDAHELLDDRGVGVRAEQPVAQQLHARGDRAGDDRRADDQGVGLDELLPVPPGVVGLGRVRPAGQVQLLEPHELDLRARLLGGPQRGDQEDLGAAAQLPAPESQHSLHTS